MAPAFFKNLRRRSRASFRTDRSTDTSSEGATSNGGTAPPSGSATPPSIAHQSDPAINLQVKDGPNASITSTPSGQTLSQPHLRPPVTPVSASNRYSSISGTSGPGAPSINGRQNMPLSPFAPRILNVPENAWVSSESRYRNISAPYPEILF